MKRTRLIVPLSVLALVACADTASEDVAVNDRAATNETMTEDAQADPWSDPASVERARLLATKQGSEDDRAATREAAMGEMEGLRILVDQSDREVRILRGEELLAAWPVAVGTEENPTPIGDFAFHRVDLNPRWVPPDSEWAEDREPQPPGDPDNPMGRARLVYQMPYTIHGTDNVDSLGKAVSHGSIRLNNKNVIPLAEMMLKAGGAYEGEAWFQEMVQNRDEEYQVPLQNDIPLTIQE